MGMGTLTIETRAADEAVPIIGVQVIIRDENRNILAEYTTDDNGQTEKLSLEAPDKDHSTSPDGPRPRYRTVQVEITKPGYAAVDIEHVQIFDGVDSYLPIHMHPLADGWPAKERYDIPQPAVDDSSPRFMPDPQPRALNEVIVPDAITVHLGRPNDNARNLRVPFQEYIKNVTASEIYPTWPRNSIIANIHAIVTFTLNRIYTEWYRSRGFPYDITNSTQFDMAFVENRNLFQNVNQLVDEYFNTYAKRIGHKNPFFTEFCNGTTATCPGMSQWGTVALANQGLTPLQILRRYYPSDLELVESNNFQSITESYPGTALREGSSGPNVKRMQDFLNRIRVNYPLIPLISNPNGYFGPETTAAVRTFQEIFRMAADGIIGRATWFRISYIFVAVTKLAELTSEGQRIGIGLAPPTSVLRLGSRGADVVELQFLLNFISRYYASVPTVIQDSVFGPGTRDSVMEFQRQFGLTPDGIVGPATWNRLYSVFKSIEAEAPSPGPSPPPAPGIPPFPGFLIRNGARGDAVRVVQNALNTVAPSIPGIPRLVEDGIFGPQTQLAVTAFQRQFGLTPDGIVGPITWSRLMNEAAGTPSVPPPTTPPPIIPPYPGFLISLGATGSHVLTIQQALNRLAARISSIPRVTEDGIFGPVTRNAVMALQRYAGLNPDGIVGPNTWARLMNEAA
ncbi:MAG: peptidoglycan-binding protein [Oscillospiraceae bacterium]|nr:peptidoglycan-binding protein [Oscillospiraceae bacterium]